MGTLFLCEVVVEGENEPVVEKGTYAEDDLRDEPLLREALGVDGVRGKLLAKRYHCGGTFRVGR